MRFFLLFISVVLLGAAGAGRLAAYPMDGYDETGIRRLARLASLSADQLAKTLPEGARQPAAAIRLNLTGTEAPAFSWPLAADPALQREVDRLFPNRHASYGLALLDITPGRPPRYAGRQEERLYSPGSVGKLAIAAGLFAELARLFPDSTEKRRQLLKNRMVVATSLIHTDHHNVPLFDPGSGSYSSRQIRVGDVFSLYEWTDHMLSASANAAASTVWKELILMRHYAASYPPSLEEENRFFREVPRSELRDLAMAVVNEPLRRAGIGKDDWQLGSLFTATGKKMVPSGGTSYANARALLTFLVKMEKGEMVDSWSSLELKKLMYMTARRIRYASSPALSKAAVYFKSGSLYRCKKEEGFSCGKYKGNVDNYMNSVAVVEQPDGRRYLAVLLSNVLKVNSAVEHQSLATFIDRIIEPAPVAPQ